MNIYKKFGLNTRTSAILNTNFTVLREITRLPAEAQEQVKTQIESGETLTVEQVRSLKMQLKAKEAVAKQEMERAEKFKSENYRLLDSVSELKNKLAEQMKEAEKARTLDYLNQEAGKTT
ncbi:MAG: hypothetical protein HQK99_14500 [Nitrospirae bacterium]|nr:hypothetical protein [Nitrospirota bacterium]